MPNVPLPRSIDLENSDIQKLLESFLPYICTFPIDKFVGLDPPKKDEAITQVLATIRDLKTQIPESSDLLDAAIQGVSGPKFFGAETGTYSNEGQAIGCAVGAAIGGALGAALGGMGAIAGAGLGCAIGGSSGRAIGERRKFVQP